MMIRNYFKIAWRNLRNNRSHSLINILGLAIGVACCMLIMLWVTDELSYDKWHDKYDRIYRPTTEINFGGAQRHFAVVPAPLAGALVSDFPEVETAMRFRQMGSAVVSTKDDRVVFEEKTVRCDSSIFEVFSLNLLKGNPKTALAAPNTMVIAESLAKKFFPNDDAMGKTLVIDGQTEYLVNGVIKDLPTNSHFDFTVYLTLTGSQEAASTMWLSNNFNTYYVLREGVDPEAFEAKVYPYLLKSYISPQVEAVLGKSYDDFAKAGAFIKYDSQPLGSIHLESDLEVEMGTNGSIQYVWLFSIAALFILLIACVNFMNLSTARSANRAKEIGVRKVLGSMRTNLINQFLVEAVLMTGIAFVVGLLISILALPYFNDLADKQLSLPFSQIPFWAVIIAGIAVVGLLAGSYPAFYLSAFRPIKVLSGKLREKGGNVNLRNSLVVFQFLIAAFMIIGTLGIKKQLNYIQQKKLGFEREQVLILDNCEPLREKAFTLKDKMMRNSMVSNATVSGFLPVPSYRSDSPLCKNSDVREDNCVSIQMWNVDENYIPVFEMEIVAGRNFSPEMKTDSNAVVINEAAAKLFGFEDPIGQTVYGSNNFDPTSGAPMPGQTIIGVVKDFHFESMRENIGPISLWLNPYPGNITLKIQTDDIPRLMANLEADWKSVAPAIPFSYRFLDDSFDQIYRSESRIGQLFSIFSGLCILIACLGLFGLAAFTVERRVKEIGIRKVLGASTVSLVSLLSKDFLKLVFIALIIAIPLAWYFMKNWMSNFAYQAEISWWVYALAGLIAIFIAFATVSFQSVKAAMANPVDSIKAE
jgi:putative ABC transport system permease protein